MATARRPVDKISTGHTACIHYIAHDYYGKRIATCSSDKTIRVFDKDDDDQWRLISPPFGGSGSGHRSAIWKVDWAHPEFGQVLASCSDDRTVIIWREKEFGYSGNSEFKIKFEVEIANRMTVTGMNTFSQPVATLMDFQKAVNSIAFAPSHLGLQLASACNDGKVRIHQGNPTNLNQWTLSSEFDVDGAGLSSYITCVSWNKNRVEQPMLAVRDIDWAPNMGRPMHLLAAAIGSSVQVWRLPLFTGWSSASGDRIENLDKPSVLPTPQEDASGAVMPYWRVGWNLTGTTLAASAENGQASMFCALLSMK
ncbi:Seh1, nuclear pore complex component [Guillardia theta CCMP2712]|uniref:Seh1, nuclear pore complex component n=1 Tax=Guillardia theta (strain CCMP2712) TaxID=905079 RepID=L1K346_GUITC|nr:Seh1, nuclear pore complex component [Guillardia theta CCMP2712]EKX55034.1 Seh1, nuclear pore complex component [Guillardia theta CCMP2712]|eukprot:XP_005842014.1 Seh1, nuclear pore complex component [Guillardia theta CCMP2712]